MDFFNVILGYHPLKSQTFWETKLPQDLNKQFEGALTEYGIISALLFLYFIDN